MRTMTEALKDLLAKYDVQFDGQFMPVSGTEVYGKAVEGGCVPLQPWRSDRRYVELYKLVDNNTIENVCLLRFSHSTDGQTSLAETLYREFDLTEFIGHGRIVSLNAVFTGGRTGNVIVKLDNGVIGSVEVGNLLPAGKDDLERHEIVARRGVANDLPMDVQIPLQSIYTYTEDGEAGYRDVDFELYGFSEKGIALIRAQYDFFKDTAKAEWHRKQHKHLTALVDAAFESDRDHRKIEIKED